jgi:hypothetical protein
MPQRYDRAVGRQAQPNQLGWSFWDMFATPQPRQPLPLAPWSPNYWNAGVNQAYASRSYRSGGDTGLKPGRRKKRSFFSLNAPPVGVEAFNRAQFQMEYGNHQAAQADLGDLFNDIMGAVIPGWDQRPQALKDIRIKPDPNKIIAAAQKSFPNAGGDIVRAANAAGMNIFVQTPMGEVLVTPQNAQLYYGNYQFITKAQGVLGSLTNNLPMIAILGGGAILLFVMLRK